MERATETKREFKKQDRENALGSLAMDLVVGWDRLVKEDKSKYFWFSKTLVDRHGVKKIN